MLKQQSLVPSGDSLLETAEGDVDSLSIWRFQRPDPNCDYRHTDFVELTAPILSIMALPMIFNDCRGCIHDESDWGPRTWSGANFWPPKPSRAAAAL
eukprot:Skav225521  [mRNA]  locus=scaffold2440:53741:58416:+ [translate_table: standard]